MDFIKNDTNSKAFSLKRIIYIFICTTILSTLVLIDMPQTSFGMQTSKCTARPNSNSSSEVFGGTGTRVTWEGQASSDEVVKKIELVFPEGTTLPQTQDFNKTNTPRMTLLSGEDNMTRVNKASTIEIDDTKVICIFNDEPEAGAFFRLEIYDVAFPAAGGDMQITGTCELKDGRTHEIYDIPTISVALTSPADQIAKSLEEQDWVKAWNSNNFLRLFFNPPLLVSSFPVVFQGFLMALAIILVAFPLSIPAGLCLAFMKIARHRLPRAIASLYINIIRGTPLFLQIYIAFFGLPLAGVQIPPFLLGVLVLIINSSAYQCEIFRAGIQSIDGGQTEAARSLGMNAVQTMLFVILPQTIRRVLPTITSDFILLYKDTSLLAAVGVMEVVMYAKTIVASTGSITPYVVAALFYLVVTIPLSRLVSKLEKKFSS